MLLDVAEGRIDLDTFIAQITDEELIDLVHGQPNRGVASTNGMGNLPRLGIPNVMTTDWQTLGDPVQELLAYNDIKMPYSYPEQVKAALENGTLTREVLCVCAKHILEMILWLE